MPDASTSAFASARHRRRYWAVLASLLVAALLICSANLAWKNPMPFASEGFWLIARMRATSVVVIIVVAFCQGLATVAFHTITNNRILTPSIMGFEALYRLVQTGAVFFFGATGVLMVQGVWQYVAQVALMVGFAAFLYGWLLTGRHAHIHYMLLIGIVLGTGLGALSNLMQRLLSPSDFDLLTARLIGNLSNADAAYLPVAIPVAALAGGGIILASRRLNVLALGKETATNLGVNHKRSSLVMLLLIAVLMAVSTSLVGPMSFLGFLIAMLSYQLANTHDHRYVLPVAWLVGVVALSGPYFVLRHVFYAQGSVGIIIEIVGGTFFLLYVLRKGRL